MVEKCFLLLLEMCFSVCTSNIVTVLTVGDCVRNKTNTVHISALMLEVLAVEIQ